MGKCECAAKEHLGPKLLDPFFSYYDIRIYVDRKYAFFYLVNRGDRG